MRPTALISNRTDSESCQSYTVRMLNKNREASSYSFPASSVERKRTLCCSSVVFQASRVFSFYVTSPQALYDVMAGGRSQSTAFLVMVAVASVICLSNVAADSSSVPDVNLVYDMTQFPWNTEAFCVTGDTTLDLTATTIPDRHKEPKVVKGRMGERQYWEL
ncbi:uncharacterized protein LOC122255252 [Penaeus japonicus]|uniref:uncharacterized protein LOC122255252 n=1 Tax=Penaeus japonicus TaxID=27405 RepID=UPI001C70C425|nr:uncharacterized protein LOC122255252 [Penaeus japonicus]